MNIAPADPRAIPEWTAQHSWPTWIDHELSCIVESLYPSTSNPEFLGQKPVEPHCDGVSHDEPDLERLASTSTLFNLLFDLSATEHRDTWGPAFQIGDIERNVVCQFLVVALQSPKICRLQKAHRAALKQWPIPCALARCALIDQPGIEFLAVTVHSDFAAANKIRDRAAAPAM
tara:strand:+ start:2069 stop:2590 length:522 start_codon:yes stop_codon:yes gene_type:complete